MIDAPGQRVLQNILLREGRSLLQYVHDAYPWTTTGEQALLPELLRLIEEERDAIGALGRYLLKRHIRVPYLGSYPMNFTNMNFVSLDFLLPLLAEYQEKSIALLGKDLDQVHDAEARAQVQQLLDLKRRHLGSLRRMTGGQAGLAAAVHDAPPATAVHSGH